MTGTDLQAIASFIANTNGNSEGQRVQFAVNVQFKLSFRSARTRHKYAKVLNERLRILCSRINRKTVVAPAPPVDNENISNQFLQNVNFIKQIFVCVCDLQRCADLCCRKAGKVY